MRLRNDRGLSWTFEHPTGPSTKREEMARLGKVLGMFWHSKEFIVWESTKGASARLFRSHIA